MEQINSIISITGEDYDKNCNYVKYQPGSCSAVVDGEVVPDNFEGEMVLSLMDLLDLL